MEASSSEVSAIPERKHARPNQDADQPRSLPPLHPFLHNFNGFDDQMVTGANAGELLRFAGKPRVGLSPWPGVAHLDRSVASDNAANPTPSP